MYWFSHNLYSISKRPIGRIALMLLLMLLACYQASPFAYGASTLPTNDNAFLLKKSKLTTSPFASATALRPQAVNDSGSQLFYPVVYNSYSDGSRTWRSTLTVQNLSTAGSATVMINFYTENGQPAVYTFTLNANGSRTIPLESINAVPSGGRLSAVITSDQPLASVNWVRVANGSLESHETYTGIAPQTATTVYMPAVAYAANGFTSNLAIQNLGSTTNDVILGFFDQNGNQTNQIIRSIPPYSTYYPSLPSFLPSGFSGSLVVSASNPIAVVDNKLGGVNNATLLTSTGAATGAQTLDAPFLATQNGYSAALTIQNISNQAATVILTNSDGNGNTQVTLPSHGSQTINYPAGSHGALLRATITSSQPVIAVAALQNTNGAGYTYPAYTEGLSDFVLPLQMKQYQNPNSSAIFNSVATFFNPGSLQAQVIINYSNGLTIQNVVNPGQYLSISLANTGDFPNGSVGSAVVTSSQPLFAFGGTSGQNAAGDLLAFYSGIAVPVPAVTLVKKASVSVLKPGDPLTYTLAFAAGKNGGSAVVADLVPSELLSHTYSVGAGVVVTPTGNTDYQWDVAVPAGGGTIQVVGIVDPAIVTSTTILNRAVITGNGETANSVVNVYVDLTPPDTYFNNTPPNPDYNTMPTFYYGGTDSGGIANFECRLDGGDWAACSASFYTTPTLGDGSHTFEVRTIDRVGQVDPTPATYAWTIDTTLAPTATPTPTTASDTPVPPTTPTNTPSPDAPTATPTNTPIPGQPTATPTNTLIPGTPTATPTLPASDATTVAQPGQPAMLTYSDPNGGGVAVQIPAGAINQTTTFLYDNQDVPSHTGSFQFAGRTFTLTAYRDNSAVNGFIFQQPVTLVIDYTDSDVAGLDENTLTLFFYDVGHDIWLEQGISVVARDPANNRITVQINHLTEFALGTTNHLYLPLINH